MMRAICAVSGERSAVPWTPHDLRRTVATRIAEQLGVGGEQLIKRVLGHSDGSVTAMQYRCRGAHGRTQSAKWLLREPLDDQLPARRPKTQGSGRGMHDL